MKRIFACLVIAITVILGGCGMETETTNNFESQEEAKAVVLERMNEKYDMEFSLAGREKYHDYGPLYGYTYTCEVAPVEDMQQVSTVILGQRKAVQMKDDYARYFFKDMVEEKVKNSLNNKDYITSYTIELKADATDKLWTEDDEWESYSKKENASIKATINFDTMKSDEEYVMQLLDLHETVKKLGMNMMLRVKNGDEYLMYTNIMAEEENNVSYSEDEMLKEMQRVREEIHDLSYYDNLSKEK